MNRIGMGIAVALGVVFTCGCRGGGRTVPPPEPEERVAAQEAPGKESAAGTEKEMVTLTGEAGNAKLGAVVVVDGAPTYLAGLDAWPEDVVGKTVEVEGWLTTSDAHEAVQDETRTVLISSHNLDDLERFADRIGIIDKGRMRLEGATADLLARFQLVDCTAPEGSAPRLGPEARVQERRGDRWRILVDTADGGTERLVESGFTDLAVTPVTLEELLVALVHEA